MESIAESPSLSNADLGTLLRDLLKLLQNRPLTEEELRVCFTKTDGLPTNIVFEEITVLGNIFLPKSALNAFRRKVYAAVCDWIQKYNRVSLVTQPLAIPVLSGKNNTSPLCRLCGCIECTMIP